MRRLPITDLARIAVQPANMRRHSLLQVKGGGGGPNYNPTRGQFAGIVNRRPGVFESVRDPWRIVGKNIIRACRSFRECKMNIPVAKSLYRYCEDHAISAVELEGYPLSFSVGPKLEAWSPALFIYPDRVSVPFLDLRRGLRLTREAQRFIFSLQHHALRVNNPDYSEVEFEIFQFDSDKSRSIRIISEDKRWLYSYDQLETMISETQHLWFEVLSGRTVELRKAAGGKGSLL